MAVVSALNVVPWYIGSGARIRAASRADGREGQVWLLHLIQQLPDRRLVVAMGPFRLQRIRRLI